MKDPFDFGPLEVRLFHTISRDLEEVSYLSECLSTSENDSHSKLLFELDHWFTTPQAALLGHNSRLNPGGLDSQCQLKETKETPVAINLPRNKTGRPTDRGLPGKPSTAPVKPSALVVHGQLQRLPVKGECISEKDELTSSVHKSRVHFVAASCAMTKKKQTQPQRNNSTRQRPEQFTSNKNTPTQGNKRSKPVFFDKNTAPYNSVKGGAPFKTSPTRKLDSGKPVSSRPNALKAKQRKAKSSSSNYDSTDDFIDLQEVLAQHNKKFKAAHSYEPRNHSIKDVKEWEFATKKSYNLLSVEERRVANEEISRTVLCRNSN